MIINGIKIENTFAEAFPMKASRIIVTAETKYWVSKAVESMTGFATSVIACGCEGGVEKVAKSYQKNFLGKIPLNIDLRIAADSGKPLVELNPDHKISKIFIEIAKKVKESFL